MSTLFDCDYHESLIDCLGLTWCIKYIDCFNAPREIIFYLGNNFHIVFSIKFKKEKCRSSLKRAVRLYIRLLYYNNCSLFYRHKACARGIWRFLFPNNVLVALLFNFAAFSFFSYSVNGLRNGVACSIILFVLALASGGNKEKIALVIDFYAMAIHAINIAKNSK